MLPAFAWGTTPLDQSEHPSQIAQVIFPSERTARRGRHDVDTPVREFVNSVTVLPHENRAVLLEESHNFDLLTLHATLPGPT